MSLRKGVAGATAAVVLCSGLCAGVALADEDYVPTTLGDDRYTNYVDLDNDIYVDGMNYVGSIGSENVDTMDETAALDNQFGTQTDTSYALRVINKLDQDITALAVKTENSDYTDLGLSSNIAANGGEACWWYTQEYEEYSFTNRSGISYTDPVTYTYQATLADGSTVEFHNVNMKGVLTLAFRYSDKYEVNYVERTTITNHTPDPNLYYETNLKNGYADDTDETYTAEEMDYHVNTAARMDDRQITASRGGGWELYADGTNLANYTEILDFGVYVPLYGEPSKDYTNGTYEYLYWNRNLIQWRVTNGDAGVWDEDSDIEGSNPYGGNLDEREDIHPGMEDGDWWYTEGEVTE